MESATLSVNGHGDGDTVSADGDIGRSTADRALIPLRALPWIEAALHAIERPLYTMVDVEAALRNGHATLHVGRRSFLLIAVEDEGSAGERIADVWLAGGDLEEIQAVLPTIEDWARAMGCTQAWIDGRRGWARALPGYQEMTTRVRKLL